MEALSPATAPLGDLAQAARTKQLKTARGILFFVGVLTVVINVIFCIFARNMVDSQIDTELADLRRQNVAINDAKVAEFREGAVRSTIVANGIGVVLGVVFFTCGMLVYKYPVPTTILSLVLYIGAAAAYGVFDPSTLARGWIIKILIVIALFKAVQAAIAYEREEKSRGMSPVSPSVAST